MKMIRDFVFSRARAIIRSYMRRREIRKKSQMHFKQSTPVLDVAIKSQTDKSPNHNTAESEVKPKAEPCTLPAKPDTGLNFASKPQSSANEPISMVRRLLLAQRSAKIINKRNGKSEASRDFIRRFSIRRVADTAHLTDHQPSPTHSKLDFDTGDLSRLIFHPQETAMFVWLGLVSLACLYNVWSVVARQAFGELDEEYGYYWVGVNLVADVIYAMDVFVQLRTGYLRQGMMEYDERQMARRYLRSWAFVLDVLALVPVKLVLPARAAAAIGRYSVSLRCIRFVKGYRAARWSEMIQNTTAYPNTWRIITLTHVLVLSCHWFAAIYYLISEYEAFATTWTYPPPTAEYASLTRKYLVCFCWAALTLTNVGADKTPETNLELIVTIVCFLLGLYVFAAIVGQVSNVVMEQNASRLEFEKILDTAKDYMATHGVPVRLKSRVIRWYEYLWRKGGIEATEGVHALRLLPDKLKTEISLLVHSKSLQKVTIFQKCRPEFLQSLVLKMHTLLCTPGEYICKKNEVAKEMFLVIEGVVEVLSDNGEVLKRFESGDFFGEIGILNFSGINRRTAHVKSVGYSQLFVLFREDVLEALQDDPEAAGILNEYANERLQSLKRSEQGRSSSVERPVLSKAPLHRNIDGLTTDAAKQHESTINSPTLQTSLTSTSVQIRESMRVTTAVSASANDANDSPTELFDLFARDMKDAFSQTVDTLVECYRDKLHLLPHTSVAEAEAEAEAEADNKNDAAAASATAAANKQAGNDADNEKSNDNRVKVMQEKLRQVEHSETRHLRSEDEELVIVREIRTKTIMKTSCICNNGAGEKEKITS